MSKRSQFAVYTSETLNESAVRQIISFLRSSAQHSGGRLTLGEHEELMTTAQGLERILEWKNEKVTKHE